MAPRVLLCPDKFKGTLTAAEVAHHLGAGLRSVRPDVELRALPVADGGDGTLAALQVAGFEPVAVTATGPTGVRRTAAYGRRGDEAVVELAAISGLAQLPFGRPEPLTATSRGTGELIGAALDAGCRRIVVGVGGSACTDGGAGLLEALGARLVVGEAVATTARHEAPLRRVASLDLTGLHPRLSEAELVVACDVDNPLTGPCGAASVYGPQKGAGPDDVRLLDAALSHWADLVAEATGTDLRDTPGAGAAGGVGFGLIAVLGAVARPGAEIVFDLIGLRDQLVEADLVLTGEGSLDAQTLHGKAPAAVAAAAREAGVPVVAVVGRTALDAAEASRAGFAATHALLDEVADPAEALDRPGPLLHRIGARIAVQHLAARR